LRRLKSIGIETAILDVPKHVLMMFNTSVNADDATQISGDKKAYVIKEGTVWIAVETTMFKNGFHDAWKEGMMEFNKWQ